MNSLGTHKAFTTEARKKLANYNWPGNVRELQNLIHFVVEICDNDIIDVQDLPPDLHEESDDAPLPSIEPPLIKPHLSSSSCEPFFDERAIAVLRELEEAERYFHRASRGYLLEKLTRKGFPITDNILRRILKDMANHQLIYIGSTKQGTKITPSGRSLLEKSFQTE